MDNHQTNCFDKGKKKKKKKKENTSTLEFLKLQKKLQEFEHIGACTSISFLLLCSCFAVIWQLHGSHCYWLHIVVARFLHDFVSSVNVSLSKPRLTYSGDYV